MDLSKLINTQVGVYFTSAVLGLGLSTFLFGTCSTNNCIELKAANPEAYTKNSMKFNGECWNFTNEAVSCGTDRAIFEY